MVSIDKCCGCYACYNICPQNCISMETNGTGDFSAIKNEEKCISCGRCEQVCPKQMDNEKRIPIFAWGGYSDDESIRRLSSSGGIFPLLVYSIIKEKGCAYGAALSDDCSYVKHIKVENYNDIRKIQGSKYIQSRMDYIYRDVKQELLTGRIVLFSGTPCQIEGLNCFLGKEYTNLVTVEVICHGVPVAELYAKYKKYLESHYNDKFFNVCFRDEEGGGAIIKIEMEHGNIYRKDRYHDSYFKLFLSDNCLRSSCYNCSSKGYKKRADITLGDFWGIEKVAPELVDGKSISVVIAHTEKGKKAFKRIQDQCTGMEVDYNAALNENKAFFSSPDEPRIRKELGHDILNVDFEKLLWKYGMSCKDRIKTVLVRMGLKKMDL